MPRLNRVSEKAAGVERAPNCFLIWFAYEVPRSNFVLEIIMAFLWPLVRAEGNRTRYPIKQSEGTAVPRRLPCTFLSLLSSFLGL